MAVVGTHRHPASFIKLYLCSIFKKRVYKVYKQKQETQEDNNTEQRLNGGNRDEEAESKMSSNEKAEQKINPDPGSLLTRQLGRPLLWPPPPSSSLSGSRWRLRVSSRSSGSWTNWASWLWRWPTSVTRSLCRSLSWRSGSNTTSTTSSRGTTRTTQGQSV